jgi:hypothetical protein
MIATADLRYVAEAAIRTAGDITFRDNRFSAKMAAPRGQQSDLETEFENAG